MPSRSSVALSLPLLPKKEVRLDFDGGDLSSDAGFVPVALADHQLRLTERLAAAVTDLRDPDKVTHPLLRLFQERIYLIALGYEDALDANTLRHDPLLKVALGLAPDAPPLAGQSTLSRFENALQPADLERLGQVLLEVFCERCGPTPRRIVLDFDPFCDPCHGEQQGRLFNGHYDTHCYLPLLLFGSIDGGRQYLIGALLRNGTAPPTKGARFLLREIVRALRARYPAVEIVVRGDAGFGNAKMLSTCHHLQLKFHFGLAQNPALQALSEGFQLRAALGSTVQRCCCSPSPEPVRVFGEFRYRAKSWRQPERVLVKVEVTQGKLNPRFVVTNLTAAEGYAPERGYQFYCERGDPENRIKEFKLDLKGDRLSAELFRPNQFRLVLQAAAYLLYQTLQDRLAAVSPQTEWARAQVGTVRSRLLKVAARVRARCRVVRIQLPSCCPWQAVWQKLLQALCPIGP